MINYELTVDEIIKIMYESGLLEDPDGVDAEEIREQLENPLDESANTYADLRNGAEKALENGDERYRALYDALVL